ncbi:MAG TPA: transglycosylase SLT domain-containing protein [Rhizomicrobium sp.]
MRRLSVLLSLLLAGSAMAQTASQPAPRPLPSGVIQKGNVIMMAPVEGVDSGSTVSGETRPGARTLSAADHDLYTRAMQAADHGDWIGAQGLAAQGHDPIARRIIEWRYLMDQNSGASFGQIDAFLRANPHWPSRNTLYIRAEAAMDPAMAPQAIVTWFGDRTPASGIGTVRLGEALIATGNVARGRELIKHGWIAFSFTPQQEIAVARAHGDILTPEVDRRRIEHLLWHDENGGVQRELSRVDPDMLAIARARLLLRRSAVQGRSAVSALSAEGQRDSGVQFDLARADRRAGQYQEAETLLLRVDRNVAAEYPAVWWNELNIAAREAIKSADFRVAYALVSNNGLSTGSELADAEFLAGWIALRKLDRPSEALEHFRKIEAAVSRPISRARAHYWEGRAAEALGDTATAWKQYRIAAQDGDTFYGQLAIAKTDATPTLHLKDGTIEPGAAARSDFDAEDLTRAIRVLADLGNVGLVRTFALYDEDLSPEAKHVVLLAQMLTDLSYRDVAVRVAKAASYDGLPILKYSHPVIAVPAYRGPFEAPETAMVLALIRQETEFDPTAVSGPGAAGLMQMMPSSARVAAQQAGLPYRPEALTTDTTYNMQLGMTEFSAHLRQWGGSYIITAAAYNAGDSNANKWLNTYGDPRSPAVDPIDWIETIPFSETRNYVMRVLENLEVYRNRLAGGDQPLRIMSDLYRPRAPEVRVLAPQSGAPSGDGDDTTARRRRERS